MSGEDAFGGLLVSLFAAMFGWIGVFVWQFDRIEPPFTRRFGEERGAWLGALFFVAVMGVLLVAVFQVWVPGVLWR